MKVNGKDLGELLLEEARARYEAGDYEPRTVFVGSDGEVRTITMPPGCDWDDPDHRMRAAYAVRLTAVELQLTAAAFVSEAWYREVPAPPDGREPTDEEIQTAVKREVIMAIVSTHEGDEQVHQAFTGREEGRIEWGKVVHNPGGSGRFANLINRPGGENALPAYVVEAFQRAKAAETN